MYNGAVTMTREMEGETNVLWISVGLWPKLSSYYFDLYMDELWTDIDDLPMYSIAINIV